MSQFHFSTELPGGDDETPEERVKAMADAYRRALNHVAVDPETRLRMLMGEAYAKWRSLMEWFKRELDREPPEVREMAARFVGNADLLLHERDDKVLAKQLELLSRVTQEPDADAGS
jgi:hypothetical protein